MCLGVVVDCPVAGGLGLGGCSGDARWSIRRWHRAEADPGRAGRRHGRRSGGAGHQTGPEPDAGADRRSFPARCPTWPWPDRADRRGLRRRSARGVASPEELHGQDEPFWTALAAFTAGSIETTAGRHDDAFRHRGPEPRRQRIREETSLFADLAVASQSPGALRSAHTICDDSGRRASAFSGRYARAIGEHRPGAGLPSRSRSPGARSSRRLPALDLLGQDPLMTSREAAPAFFQVGADSATYVGALLAGGQAD
jgi:hypothetical protein